MTSPLCGVAAINAITFGVYGNALKMFSNPDSITSITLAGSTAGLIQVGSCGSYMLSIGDGFRLLGLSQRNVDDEYQKKQINIEKQFIRSLLLGANFTYEKMKVMIDPKTLFFLSFLIHYHYHMQNI